MTPALITAIAAIAAALGVAAIALNYSVIQSEPAEDFAATDAIPELLGIT